MKLNVLWEVRSNEIERFAMASMLIGFAMVVIGITWDWLAGIHVHHSQGLGTMQILWTAAWGLYSFWAWAICSKWGEK